MNFNPFKKEVKSNNTLCRSTILIDDNDLDNFINEKMIQGNRFAEKIDVFTHGQKALDHIESLSKNKTSDTNTFPQIIFLDLNMPEINGFTFLDKLESLSEIHEQINEIKVVILTSSIYPEDIEKATSHRLVIEFFNKPLSQEKLNKIKTKYFTA